MAFIQRLHLGPMAFCTDGPSGPKRALRLKWRRRASPFSELCFHRWAKKNNFGKDPPTAPKKGHRGLFCRFFVSPCLPLVYPSGASIIRAKQDATCLAPQPAAQQAQGKLSTSDMKRCVRRGKTRQKIEDSWGPTCRFVLQGRFHPVEPPKRGPWRAGCGFEMGCQHQGNKSNLKLPLPKKTTLSNATQHPVDDLLSGSSVKSTLMCR